MVLRTPAKTALALLALTVGLAVAAASPAPALAEFCRPVMPDHPQDARGFTFRAHVSAIRAEGDGQVLTYITLAVDKVYANRDSERLREGQSIEVYSNSCDGFGLLGLEAGEEVLMSTAFLEAADGPGTWNTVVWRVEAGNLRILVLHGEGFEKVWYTSDRRIARADTLREALALVAPAAVGIPDTATEPLKPSGGQVLPLVFAGVGAFFVSLMVLRPSATNVLVTLSVIVQLFGDATALSDPWSQLARSGIPAAAILMPVGFFAASAGAGRTSPSGLVAIVYLGAVMLALGALALGIGLLVAPAG